MASSITSLVQSRSNLPALDTPRLNVVSAVVFLIPLLVGALATWATFNFAPLVVGIFLGLLLGLVIANFAVIVASLSRHEDIARSITKFLSSYIWLLRMGGDADPANRDSHRHA